MRKKKTVGARSSGGEEVWGSVGWLALFKEEEGSNSEQHTRKQVGYLSRGGRKTWSDVIAIRQWGLGEEPAAKKRKTWGIGNQQCPDHGSIDSSEPRRES